MNIAMVFVACSLGWSSWDTPIARVSICSRASGVEAAVVAKDGTRIEFDGTAVAEKDGIKVVGRSRDPIPAGRCRVSAPSFFAALPSTLSGKMRVGLASASGLGLCPMLGGGEAVLWSLDLSGRWELAKP
jgi:hypothetical protein